MSAADQLLDKVHDQKSFIEFVEALAEERNEAELMEHAQPEIYMDGALNWKNSDIQSFLYSALMYFEPKPLHKPEAQPSWKMMAEFLYYGKIYE
jgi:hypothetical protein